MAWLPKSIRWRFQIWLAFLLACVLIGFGVSAYELMVANQDHQIYEQLQHRLSAVASDLTRSGGPRGGRSRDHDHDRGDRNRDRDHDRRNFFDRDDFRRGSRVPSNGPPHEPPGAPPHPNPLPQGGEGEEKSHAVAVTEKTSPELSEPCHTNDTPEVVKPGEPHTRPPFPFPPSSRDNRDNSTVQLSREVLELFNQADPNGFYFVIWTRDGVERLRATNVPPSVTTAPPARSTSGPQFRVHGQFQESYLQHSLGNRILVGRSIAPELDHRRTYALWLTTAGVAILIVGLCGSWRLASRSLRPLTAISAAATHISHGNLSERINVAETDDELGQLAGTLNHTFARLETAFVQQKQFTADAAHELRTPLAVMISEAQTTLARERSAAEYRETIEACLDSAQQMRRLTESLLQLARFDGERDKIQRQPLDLAGVARSCLAQMHPLVDSRGLKIQAQLSPATALGDADHLSRVITNLLTNAVHYNKASGEIRVRTCVENGQAVLSVADTGIGIAPEDLPQVFERFYRADKSRARPEGRYGLGLAICKSIVDAHGGQIEVQSHVDRGSTFIMRLPLPAKS